MRCPTDGRLRALLDGGDADAEAHLRGCERCRRRLESLRARTHRARVALSALEPTSTPPVEAALEKVWHRAERESGMSEFGRRSLRPYLAAGLVVVAMIAALAISPMRSAAFGWLGIIKVERFEAITVDVSELPFHPANATGERALSRAVLGELHTQNPDSRPQKVGSIQKAGSVMGRQLATAGNRIAGEGLGAVYVTRPERASYTVDLARIQSALDREGAKGVRLPQELDGKTFTLNVPRGAIAVYGRDGQHEIVFAQGASPWITIPQGVNMDYVRQDILQIPGLPKDLVRQLQEVRDWKHTLVVPIPRGGSSRHVSINGSDGLLISDRTGELNVVLWQRDGQLYALGGHLSSDQALASARSVRYP